MAKDSDKLAVLERRRIELLHAIKHELSEEQLLKRVQRVKQAVFAVAKQYHVRGRPFKRFENNLEWQRVERFWESLSSAAVIELVTQWKPGVSYKTILAPCRSEDESSPSSSS